MCPVPSRCSRPPDFRASSRQASQTHSSHPSFNNARAHSPRLPSPTARWRRPRRRAAMPPSRLPDDPELRAALFADARLAPILSTPSGIARRCSSPRSWRRGPPRRRRRRRRSTAPSPSRVPRGRGVLPPASAVKLFAAAAACAALARLRARAETATVAASPSTPPRVRAPPPPRSRLPSRDGAAPADPPSPTPNRPRPPAGSTPAKPLRVTLHELFLVSDNDAYNRCYDLAGPDAIRRWVRSNVGARAARDVRVCHRLFDEARDGDDATRLPEVWAEIEEGAWIRLESSRTQRIIPPAALTPSRRATNKRRRREGGDRGGIEKTPRDVEPSERRRPDCIGVARIEPGGARVDAPLDCSARNAAPLEALQNALAALARPDVLPLAESESESESDEDADADACTDRSGRSGDGGDGARPGGSSDERPSGSLTLSSEHREALLAAARALPTRRAAAASVPRGRVSGRPREILPPGTRASGPGRTRGRRSSSRARVSLSRGE